MVALNFRQMFRQWLAGQPETPFTCYDINNTEPASSNCGFVDLVGAGPGDPELLTRRAYQAILSADAIIYDALVSQAIVDIFPDQTESIYVGKRQGQHSTSQPAIGALLIQMAASGKYVVRLKGGDPLIFGRLSEELTVLRQAGIPHRIVPGITAAAGCAAACGFPLTDREQASSLRFVTGHHHDDSNPDWESLATCGETLVFYMGLSQVTHIAHQLQKYGLPSHWPCLVVENGTLKQQRAYRSSLVYLPDVIRKHRIQPPAIIYVGQVVKNSLSLVVADAEQQYCI